MFKCGLFYLNGHGIGISKPEAAKYFRIAADNEHEASMYIYGLMAESGDRVELNLQEALKYYKIGAENGSTDCMHKCGYFFIEWKRSL